MTSPTSLNADFRDLLECFSKEHVEYVLVGAYALAFHGVPRATGDMDVFIRPSPANAERAWRALREFGAPLAAASVRAEDLATPGTIYQVGLPPRRIDILTEISGTSFEQAWDSRMTVELESLPIHFIGRNALIANKRASGRLKDLADVERLEGTDPR